MSAAKPKVQFGGIAALFTHEIDLLVTPASLRAEGLHFEPVFDPRLGRCARVGA